MESASLTDVYVTNQVELARSDLAVRDYDAAARRAEEVLKVAPDAVEAPPEMISAIGVEYITGVAKVEARLIILLELGKVLNIEDMRKVGYTVERVLGEQAA